MASELGVQTIQHTNGTDALTVGSDGALTTTGNLNVGGSVNSKGLTYIPSFSARGGGGPVSATNIGTYDNYETGVTHNVGSHYSYTNKEFTCPVDGLYLFTVSAYSNNGNDGAIRLTVNDAHTENTPQLAFGAGLAYTIGSVQAVLNLSANDTVQTYVRGGSIYFDSDCWFTGVLIG